MKIESMSHIENENKMEKIHRFFDIDAKTEQKLKKEIQKSKGLVRVFIHPDFGEYSTYSDIKDNLELAEQLKDAQKIFERVIVSKSEHLPPVFIFESGWHSDEFKEKEEALMKISSRDIYIVRTEGANPNPLPPDHEEGIRFMEYHKVSKKEREEMWKWVIEELKTWGVKKILIGGLELYVSKDEEKAHGGCLGFAIEKLRNHFNLEISSMTWPEKIQGLKKSA